ncbi:MAG: tetratricopeptide repeat protein, partial [Candidatus Tectomicrobia bacterium]|nr:tetratricopeptide repeat protein [Candidatus Tectomicrobia bacterium]
MVRLHLTEVVMSPSETQLILEQLGSVTANIEDARKRAKELVTRFEKALEAGVPMDELRRSLVIPAINALREAGAEREARELSIALNRKIAEVSKEPYHPKVFISYSHDSPQHMNRVLDLSNRLRADGIDCHIDQYETSPPEGWPRWMINQIEEADFVLMVCTETYERRFRGGKEAGKGLGAKWEGAIITQELYETEANNTKFIPVLFSSGNSTHIPIILRGATRYDLSTDEGYWDLYCHLTSQQGKYNEAEPLFKRVLAILEKTLGSDHPSVAQSLNNLGLLYYSQGKYTEAEPLYQRAVAIREKILGSNHPNLATSLNNLAGLYHAQGKHTEAESLYQRSLEIR